MQQISYRVNNVFISLCSSCKKQSNIFQLETVFKWENYSHKNHRLSWKHDRQSNGLGINFKSLLHDLLYNLKQAT